MDDTKNLLIQGYGYSARTFHIPLVQKIPQYRLQSLVTSRAPNDIPTGLFTQIEHDFNKAVLEPAVDLVVLTGPNQTHGPLTRAALLADKDVLVEKPFTTDSQEAKELMSLAKEKNRRIHVFQNRRLDGDFLSIQQALKDGRLGGIKRLVSRMDRYRPNPKKRWKESGAPGSGLAWDLGSHLLDQCLVLFGLPELITGDFRSQREGGLGVDAFDLILEYPWGAATLGSHSFCHSRPTRFQIDSTKGTWKIHGFDPQEERLKGENPMPQESLWESQESHPAPPLLSGNYQDLYQSILSGNYDFGPEIPSLGVFILEQMHQQRILSRGDLEAYLSMD